MFGVKSPVTAPPKFVFVVVKLPTPRPPNACTAACGSWAEAGDVTQKAAASSATNGRVRMVDNLTDAGTLTLGKRCTRSEAANSFDKWAAGAHAGPHCHRWTTVAAFSTVVPSRVDFLLEMPDEDARESRRRAVARHALCLSPPTVRPGGGQA